MGAGRCRWGGAPSGFLCGKLTEVAWGGGGGVSRPPVVSKCCGYGCDGARISHDKADPTEVGETNQNAQKQGKPKPVSMT